MDTADRMRLKDCKEELEKLLVEEVLFALTSEISRSLVADICQQTGFGRGALRRSDSPSNYNLLRQVLALDDIKTHSWHIQACSAVTGENLVKGMEWIVDDVARRLYTFA